MAKDSGDTTLTNGERAHSSSRALHRYQNLYGLITHVWVQPQSPFQPMTILHWKYWRHKAFLLSVYGLLQAIRLGLWTNQFQRLTDLSYNLPQRLKQTRLFEPVSVAQITRAVHWASLYSPGTVTCLPRAMATQFLLESAGYAGELKIGVLKDETGTLEAHAWVEYQGTVVIGQVERLADFVPLRPRFTQ